MINLKKYKFVYPTFVVLTLVGCNLEPENPNDFGEDDVTADLFAVGMYQAYQKVTANEYLITELRSDNAISENGSGDIGAAERFNLTPAYGDGSSYWANNYSVILNANQILVNEATLTESSSGMQSLAEAYFMRALCHFNLTRAFLQVPYINAVISDPADLQLFPTVGVFDEQVLYNNIINDFSSAINFFNQVSGSDNIVRNKANLAAAYGFLAKALMSQPNKDYSGALSILNTHLHPDGNNFNLSLREVDLVDREAGIEDYIEIFQGDELNDEILFAISYSESDTDDAVTSEFNIDDQIQNGSQEWSVDLTEQGSSGGILLTDDLLTLILVNDETLGTVPEPIRGGDRSLLMSGDIDNFDNGNINNVGLANFSGTTGFDNSRDDFYSIKYRDLDDTSGIDAVVLRYADILLLFSEAILQGADSSSPTAINMYNRVRNRVGATPLPEDGSEFLTIDELLDERRRELNFENHRIWDLIRFGRAQSTFRIYSQNDFEFDINYATGEEFLPIPSREIDATTRNGVAIYDQNAAYR